jgi:flagellar protein FliS
MSGECKFKGLAAYQSVATHGGVAAADPHGLIVMLMDGVLERIAMARGAAQRGATAEKAKLLHRAVAIIDELRNSLDFKTGGEIATNLDSLYEYICRRLMHASIENRIDYLDESSALLTEIRGAWLSLPASARALRPSTP